MFNFPHFKMTVKNLCFNLAKKRIPTSFAEIAGLFSEVVAVIKCFVCVMCF